MENKASNKQESMLEDIIHLKRLKEGDSRSFDFLFNKYYKDLVLFSCVFLKEQNSSEDIVQDIFFRLWENRENLSIESSLKAYLLTAVKNSCFEELRHREVVRTHQNYVMGSSDLIDYNTEHYLLYSDLNDHLQEAIKKLPEDMQPTYSDLLSEDMRTIFEMNRFKNLKYREIAEELNVSVRTVESKISKSLEFLRKHLSGFYDLILLFIINLMR